MGLDETIIVPERKFRKLYENERDRQFLEDNGFLPLDVGSLTTRQGKALLHLANFVYLSGDLRSSDFRPRISGKRNTLDLIEDLVHDLNIPFTYDGTYSNGGNLLPSRYGGLIGRLLYCMGVPKPDSSGNGRQRKSRAQHGLPHYFQDVVKAKPDIGQVARKQQLVYVILRDLFADRLKIIEKNAPYLQLNHYRSKNFARKYGLSVIRFLNTTLKSPRDIHLQQRQLSVDYDRSIGLYDCRIQVTDAQLNYLKQKNLINNL